MRLLFVPALCLALACTHEVVTPADGASGAGANGGAGASSTGGHGGGGAQSGGGGSGGGTSTSTGGSGGSGATGGVSSGGSGGSGGGSGGSGGGGSGPLMVGDLVPDFSLIDANTASPTSGLAVSPRDYLEQVSGWYFGHST